MKRLVFFILLVVCLLCGCKHSSVYPAFLIHIDSLSEVCPDSALKLLVNLKDTISNSPKNEQMYYRLLNLKAKSFAYKSLADDTLVYEIVDYYKQTDEKALLLQAYYYAGKVSRQRLNFIQAVNYFQKVIETCDDKNLSLKSQAYSQLNYIYDQQWLDEDALEMCKSSLAISKEINDTVHQIFSLRDMGNLYYDLGLCDSAYICYTSALKLARLQNNEEMESVAACQLARYYNHEKQYDTAKKYIRISLNYDDPNDRSGVFYNAANVYKGLGMTDSVIYFYRKLLDYGNVYTKKEAFKGLYEFYDKVHKEQEAHYFFNEYVKYVDSIQDIRTTNIVKQQECVYDYNKKEKQIASLEAKNKTCRVVIYVLSSVIACMFIVYIYKYGRKALHNKKAKAKTLDVTIKNTKIYKRIMEILTDQS